MQHKPLEIIRPSSQVLLLSWKRNSQPFLRFYRGQNQWPNLHFEFSVSLGIFWKIVRFESTFLGILSLYKHKIMLNVRYYYLLVLFSINKLSSPFRKNSMQMKTEKDDKSDFIERYWPSAILLSIGGYPINYRLLYNYIVRVGSLP